MHITNKKLKQDLKRIEQELFQLREREFVQDFVSQMLHNIGDPEPELRDNLIYTTFYKWIIESNKFTDEDLRNLLSILIDKQHLLYHLGNSGDLTVLTRSFSVLPVALILHRHLKQPFLTISDYQSVKNACCAIIERRKIYAAIYL